MEIMLLILIPNITSYIYIGCLKYMLTPRDALHFGSIFTTLNIYERQILVQKADPGGN